MFKNSWINNLLNKINKDQHSQNMEVTEENDDEHKEETHVGNRYRLEFLKCGHIIKCEGVITEENIEEGYFYFRIVDEACASDATIDDYILQAWLTPMKIYYNSVIKSARLFVNTDW